MEEHPGFGSKRARLLEDELNLSGHVPSWQEVFEPLTITLRVSLIFFGTSSKTLIFLSRVWSALLGLVFMGFSLYVYVASFLPYTSVDLFTILQSIASAVLTFLGPLGAYTLHRFLSQSHFSSLLSSFLSSCTPNQIAEHRAWFRSHFLRILGVFVTINACAVYSLTVPRPFTPEFISPTLLILCLLLNMYLWILTMITLLIYRVLSTRLESHIMKIEHRQFSTPEALLASHFELVDLTEDSFHHLRSFIGYAVTVICYYTIAWATFFYRSSYLDYFSIVSVSIDVIVVSGYFHAPGLFIVVCIARVNSFNDRAIRLLNEGRMFELWQRLALKSDLENIPIQVTIYNRHPASKGLPALTFSNLGRTVLSLFISLLPLFAKLISNLNK